MKPLWDFLSLAVQLGIKIAKYLYREEKFEEGKMDTQRAIQIASREWENIRISLEICGDIGEFSPKDYINMNGRFALPSLDMQLVRNLIEMDNKLPMYGYFTQEAAYVFTTLASRAGKRIGLIGRVAKTFGIGYSLVRTGCLSSERSEKQRKEQMTFFRFFFRFGGGFNWNFHSPGVKMRMKFAFDKFVEWQRAKERREATQIEKWRAA